MGAYRCKACGHSTNNTRIAADICKQASCGFRLGLWEVDHDDAPTPLRPPDLRSRSEKLAFATRGFLTWTGAFIVGCWILPKFFRQEVILLPANLQAPVGFVLLLALLPTAAWVCYHALFLIGLAIEKR